MPIWTELTDLSGVAVRGCDQCLCDAVVDEPMDSVCCDFAYCTPAVYPLANVKRMYINKDGSVAPGSTTTYTLPAFTKIVGVSLIASNEYYAYPLPYVDRSDPDDLIEITFKFSYNALYVKCGSDASYSNLFGWIDYI